MRRAKRTGGDEPGARGQQPRHAVDARDLHRLVARHVREDGRHGAGEERLAAARRPAHDNVVAARGRHFERALGVFLANHVAEIEARR
jgi:hypothetical protein